MNGWTSGEKAIIAAAVRSAPSVHNTQPWRLEFRERGVSLLERLDLSLSHHDPTGRDRMISCGAALADLLLAVRILGRDADFLPFPDPRRPDEVARVVTGEPRKPSTVDIERYAAIPWRHSYRRPFAGTPVPDSLRHDLAAAAAGVRVRPVRPGETEALAGLLMHTALALRDDRGYQRELTVWTNTGPGRRPGGGIPERSLAVPTLPWAGLVRRGTSLPDLPTLTARLERECLLLLETPDDGPLDHLLTGQALQDTWLSATDAGLAGSVLTQPLHVAAVRAGLIERLELPGFPQALLRFGYPLDALPPTPRMPLADLVRHEPPGTS
jgi:hypothetical protein